MVAVSAMAIGSMARAEEEEAAPEPAVTYRIVMVDPRVIVKTAETQAVGWQEKRSDVMGSVHLSREESAKLGGILAEALTSSENVPFCGHSPAYVIVRLNDGKPAGWVSVCFLCKTWCDGKGDLRVLDDSRLMPFLTGVLPLPPAFSGVVELRDLVALGREKSFLELPSQP